MADVDGKNGQRSLRVEALLMKYCGDTYSGDEDTVVCDVLADLMHLCDQAPKRFGTFADALMLAQMHFDAEVGIEPY
jgi:hypothetical protein